MLLNLNKIMKQKFSGKKIGLPLIGAGLASGNWETIESIIKEELLDEDVTVVIWEKGNNNPVSI
jgi:O-acetyl-ADP-ribose deacetylase (regulator of RNase III)